MDTEHKEKPTSVRDAFMMVTPPEGFESRLKDEMENLIIATEQRLERIKSRAPAGGFDLLKEVERDIQKWAASEQKKESGDTLFQEYVDFFEQNRIYDIRPDSKEGTLTKKIGEVESEIQKIQERLEHLSVVHAQLLEDLESHRGESTYFPVNKETFLQGKGNAKHEEYFRLCKQHGFVKGALLISPKGEDYEVRGITYDCWVGLTNKSTGEKTQLAPTSLVGWKKK